MRSGKQDAVEQTFEFFGPLGHLAILGPHRFAVPEQFVSHIQCCQDREPLRIALGCRFAGRLHFLVDVRREASDVLGLERGPDGITLPENLDRNDAARIRH
jgi:hypothetical protein